jgi:hypothetical protein
MDDTQKKMKLSRKVINQVKSPQTIPYYPTVLKKKEKKDKCSNLVIWTSTMSNIRIQKLFVIGTLVLKISLKNILSINFHQKVLQ